jgi:spore coat polysaccharide biosynthesis protein SpsF
MAEGFKTEQEAFWSGAFGDDYVDRNRGEVLAAGRTHLFSNALRRAGPVGSAVEFGPNIGLNLVALRRLLPAIDLAAVEINAKAVESLKRMDGVEVHHGSILDRHVTRTFELAFCSGVLIHIAPGALPTVYDNLHAASHRLILLAEYYNPAPVAIPYRGHAERLFKRDFAGEMLDRFPDLRLVDYGFQYHRDPNFPADDLNWFLMEKNAR